MKNKEIKIGDEVNLGKYTVGIFRGLDTQGLAKVEIGINLLVNPAQPLIAIVPLDELEKIN